MNHRKAGGIALIAASIASVSLMSFHPTHGGGPLSVGPFDVNQIVHSTALLAGALVLYGFVALARWLGADRPVVMIALSFAVLGTIAMLIAATISGFVTGRIVVARSDVVPGLLPALMQVGQLAVALNRAFARVYIAFFSVAFLLWALGWPSRDTFGKIARGVGLLVGGGILAWLLSGTFKAEVHPVLIVAVGQALWLILAGSAMLRAADEEGSA
jgi:hypothetical protein